MQSTKFKFKKLVVYCGILSLRYITLLIKSLHSAVCIEKRGSMNPKIVIYMRSEINFM